MLKQKTVYFREEDLPLWEAIENKAEWLHAKLTGLPEGTRVASPEKAKEMAKNYRGSLGAPIIYLEQEDDPLANFVWEERTHTLTDTETGEILESDPDTIKELKRRGQVK